MDRREDEITLAGIRISARIGTTPEERSSPQECTADLTIGGSFADAAETDALDRSVDYTRVLALVLETAAAREYNLVETLAYRIVRAVLQSFPVRYASIRLRKRPAVMSGLVDFVEVKVEESSS